MSRFQFPPPAPTSFPIAATTVTDNFNRANENPIGAPWDTSGSPGGEASLTSNHMTSVDRTGYWDGDACYPGPFLNVESIVTVSTDLSLLTGGYVFLGYNSLLSTDAINEVQLDATNFTFFDQIIGDVVTPISFSIGDKIGLRSYGLHETGWYLPVGGSGWQLMGSKAGSIPPPPPVFRGDIEVYLYADDGPVTISEFRVAEVGQLIPQKPVSGSSRNSW